MMAEGVSQLSRRGTGIGGKPLNSASSVSEQDEWTEELLFPNLSHWVCCFCVVTFDLELGQALEVCDHESLVEC